MANSAGAPVLWKINVPGGRRRGVRAQPSSRIREEGSALPAPLFAPRSSLKLPPATH